MSEKSLNEIFYQSIKKNILPITKKKQKLL